MQNNNFYIKHLRGSSGLQETEQRQDESVMFPVPKRSNLLKELSIDTSESVSDNWVRGLRSIHDDETVSPRGDQRKNITAQQNDKENQSADERWLDDGGESGEAVA